MNKVFLIGNLTKDPEMRTSPSGLPVCSFTLAVNKKSQSDHPEATFFRVTAWRQLAENCGKYLVKGRKAAVLGEVSASAYVDRQGNPRASLEVTADSVEFLSPRGQGQAAAHPDVDENGYVAVPPDEEINF